VIVVPQQQHLPETIDYIRRSAPEADVVMSVCTGAFLVAEAGLFDGGRATTHHGGYDRFAQRFPKVMLVRGPRYVEDPNVSSSGGESCGIDLSLRVVERYYGRKIADAVAHSMEYRRTPRPTGPEDV
jgi:transcriptional regulator GlxA family with amidase domain